MLRSRCLVVGLAFAIVAAACGPTPTPTPAPLGEPDILSPEDGEVVQPYQSTHWRVQALSTTQVLGFGITFCNSDVQRAWFYPDTTGSAGQNGTVFYGEEDIDYLIEGAGDCTIKVSAIDVNNEKGPPSQVTLLVADPPTVDSIQMEIMEPAPGEVIPPDSEYSIRLRADSFSPVIRFELQICVVPGETSAFLPNDKGQLGMDGFPYFLVRLIPSFEEIHTGACTLRARAITGGPEAQASEWAEVQFYIGESLVEVNPGVPPMLPTPTNTPFSKSFQATAKMNANCRAGPSTAHNEWGYALKDDIVEVVGRNEDGTWLNVLNPHGAGKCWLSIFALDVPFDVNGLPAVSYPTPPPSDGGQPPAAQGCLVATAAGGMVCMAPCPAGAAPGTACTP